MLIACVDQHMASSSSRDPMPSNAPENLSVQLWLPEGFDMMLVPIIAEESDTTHQGALSRCLEGLCTQIHTSHSIASQELLSEATKDEMHFSQYRIYFGNGVDPFRLKCFCSMLRATTDLFVDEVWDENAGMLLSLPEYCGACDVFGHSTAACTHFHGQVRTEQGFVPREHM